MHNQRGARLPGAGGRDGDEIASVSRRLPPRAFRRLIERTSPVLAAPGRVPSETDLPGYERGLTGPGLGGLVEVCRPPRSVLIVRTDELGDLAMTLPLLTALRAAWPQARVTFLARDDQADLLRGGALVDEVVGWPDPVTRGDSPAGQFRCWRLGRRLLHRTRPLPGRFDLAVLPARETERFGARYVACTAARRVVGFDPAASPGAPGEAAERDLLSEPVRVGDPNDHALRHAERLAEVLGVRLTPDAYDAPGLAVIGPAERERARCLLSPLVVASPASAGPVLAVDPGAWQARGIWPAAAYAEAVGAVHDRTPVRVLLLGRPGDRDLADAFTAALKPSVPLVSAVGRAGPRVQAALLAECAVHLGGVGDTMHLACAVATACVTVSGHPAPGVPDAADAPERVGPWSVGSRVIRPDAPAGTGCADGCTAGSPHCITSIGVPQVTRAVLAVLAGRPAGGPSGRPGWTGPSAGGRPAGLPAQLSRSWWTGLARA